MALNGYYSIIHDLIFLATRGKIKYDKQILPYLPIHHIHRCTIQPGADIVGGAVHNPLSAFPGGPGNVGGDDTVPGRQKGIVCPDGLCGHHIQAGGADFSTI